MIFANSSKGSPTSIDDINRILGLSDKTLDIQKKHRSDLTLSINRKFTFITKGNTPLLRRSRSDLDKRSFEYFIEAEDYECVSQLIERGMY